MGALPKQKVSRSKQGRRRSHQALVLPRLVTCTNCAAKIASHTVCNVCGYYKDEEIVKVRVRPQDQNQ